jgi:tight adherence protein C
MHVILLRLLMLVALIGPGQATWAQNTCPDDFARIDSTCIQNTNRNYGDALIPLSAELKDNIYFYKTPAGEFGKLRVIGVNITKLECNIFLEAVTYTQSGSYIPNSSITISASRSNFLKSRIFLDRQGLSALELDRPKDKKGCVLALSKGSQLAYFMKAPPAVKREEYNLLFYSPLILVFIAIFIIVRVFMEEQDKFKTQEALEEAESAKAAKPLPLFIKVTKPFYKRYFLPLVQGSKNKQGMRTKYRQKLANAGLIKEMTPEEFMALKIFMILGGPVVFLTIRWFMEESWPLSITPVMGVVGFFYPNIWLDGIIKKRGEEVLRAMPFIVDMLALSVEAGLDFMAAIQRVIEKAPSSPLVEEFETLIRETKIGSSRAEGLRQLGWRVNIIEINSFCATLIAADSVGASIAPILKQLSNELRIKRSSRAEQQGATAATKILIPMIFFILPAVLVAIFAPMVLKMMAGKL